MGIRSDITYIFFDLNEKRQRWGVSADPRKATSVSLKEHLEKYVPNAVFVRAEYHDEDGFVFEYGSEITPLQE